MSIQQFKRHCGNWLIATGLLHQVVGLYFYSDALADIWHAGIFNSVVPPYWERDAAFWFFMFGVMLILYGAITQWTINNIGTVPKFWGWALLLMSISALLFMPASGFWLALPIAWAMIELAQSPMQISLAS